MCVTIASRLLGKIHYLSLELVRKRSSRLWHVSLLNTSCHLIRPGNSGRPTRNSVFYAFHHSNQGMADFWCSCRASYGSSFDKNFPSLADGIAGR